MLKNITGTAATDAAVGVFIEDAADEIVNNVKVVLEEINDAMTDADFEAELA